MMNKALFTLALLASAFALPLAAHADTIDDFVLTGGGHTITFSLPATASNPDFGLFNFFDEGSPATIDGVSGDFENGQYNALAGGIPVTVIFTVFSSDFVLVSTLDLGGSRFFSVAFEPASNPPPDFQEDVVLTFIPGTYTLQGLSSFGFFPLDPPVDYTLTITPEASITGIPEPSSLALLTTGTLALLAFATRRKRTHPLLKLNLPNPPNPPFCI